MSNSKYIVYKCSVCKRETEILLNAKRPDPVRCNITLRCRGSLSRVGERTNKGFLFTPLVPGLDDYMPRGSEVTVIPTVKAPNPVTIYSGSNIIAAACFRRETDGDDHVTFWTRMINGSRLVVETPVAQNAVYPVNAKVVVSVFELTPALLKFKRYTYNVGIGAQLIRGIDNSREGKNLRFEVTNSLKVILNGVELDYTQYDATVANQITLTPAVTTPNSILEVLVWDEIPTLVPTTDMIELSFVPLTLSNADLEARNLTCWGDYSAVDFTQIERPGSPLNLPDNDKSIRSLLYCLDLTDLDPTKSYAVGKIEAQPAGADGRTQILPSDFYIMLGKEPFLFQDKELHAFVSGSKLLNQTTVLNFRQSTGTGSYELVVDQDVITQKFNPVSPVFPASRIAEDQTASETVLGTEDLKRKYILGPS